MWVDVLSEGVDAGALRADLDVDLVYRFIRDTIWVAVRWYRPGGTADRRPGRATSTSPSSWTESRPKEHDMPEAYIVDAVRTAGRQARRVRWPACTPPTSARTCCAALFDRTGVDPGAVDDVIVGCCDTIGSQAGNIARTAWLAAGLPEDVPGVTVDRQCGSSPAGRALRRPGRHVRHRGPDRGRRHAEHERRSRSPRRCSSAEQFGFTTPFAESQGWLQRYGDQEVSQFRSAEMIAEKWDITREEMEEFALALATSGRCTAIDEGRFEQRDRRRSASFDIDEGPRDTSLEKMAGARSRWPRAAGSPRRWPARSPTRRRRCCSPPSRRSRTTA